MSHFLVGSPLAKRGFPQPFVGRLGQVNLLEHSPLVNFDGAAALAGDGAAKVLVAVKECDDDVLVLEDDAVKFVERR
jgi:hypothetical protein